MTLPPLATQDRGMAAAFNRMSLYASCTKKYWKDVFDAVKDDERAKILKENMSVLSKIKESDRRSAL
jgi:hypothetical protein